MNEKVVKNSKAFECAPKISVLMPSLNMVKYIGKCLDSVIKQTLFEIEIICIDAGSTDGTIEIIEEYARNDLRIKIVHSQIRSYGYQMNLGISIASGEYISIIETDDIAQNDMLERLYECTVDMKPDYVKGTASLFYENSDSLIEVDSYIPCDNLRKWNKDEWIHINPSESPELFFSDNFLWNGIYKKEFMSEILFRESRGAAFQDISVLFRMISTAQNAVYLNHKVYLYRQDNINASSYNRNGFRYVEEEYSFIIDHYLIGLNEEWKSVCYKKFIMLTINRFYEMVSSGEVWDDVNEPIETIGKKIEYAFSSHIIEPWNLDENHYLIFKNMQINVNKIFEIYKELFASRVYYISEIMDFIGTREVVIVGCGVYGKFLADLLRIKSKINIRCFMDNALDKQGTVLVDIPIMKPQKLACEDVKYIIAVGKSNLYQVRDQFVRIGVQKEDIFVYQMKELDFRLFR